MLVTTYSEARKTFASVLDRARTDGAVLIKRADGSLFRLSPEQQSLSPFAGISTNLRLPAGALRETLEGLKDETAARGLKR